MKLQNYSDQIRDIFIANKEHDGSDEDSDDEIKSDFDIQVRISKLNKVMKDIGYLVGIVFCEWKDYVGGNFDEKKTTKDIIEQFKKVVWKKVHEGI